MRAVAAHAISADIGNVHVHVRSDVAAAPLVDSSDVSDGGCGDDGGDVSFGFGSTTAGTLTGLDAAASAACVTVRTVFNNRRTYLRFSWVMA